MKNLPSALSTAALVVLTTLGVPLPHAAVAAPTFIQGTAFSTAPTSATTVTLNRPVSRGDLLVGWVAEYNAPGQVQVSDNVNGAWMRAPRAMKFEDETGDIALYYRENSQAAPGGLTITVSAPSSAYLQGTLADYSSVALAGSLDQIVSAFTPDGTVVDTGLTAAVDAGELVFAALVASPGAGSITPGRSQGVPYTPRAQTSTGAAFAEDITSSAAGPQQGTATLSSTTDWYAVCAVFHPYPATPPVPPSTPAGLHAVSAASTRIALSWSPSSGSVAGYTVYRSGFAIGTTGPDTTSFLDTEVTPSATYTYSVDAFDLANDHSARSTSLRVTAPAQSPEFVQGVAVSPPSPQTSYTLTLSEPVLAGDLLVGWFGQYAVAGQVQVSDNVNGPWTRSVSTTWGGSGDIALYYRQNSAPAPSGLRIMVSASAPAYLQEAVADYRHVATVGALDQAMVSQGVGSFASVGPTAPVPGGELVVAAVLTGGQPASAIAGTSQLVPYLLDVQNGSASSDLADILSSAAGPQQGSLSLGSATNWNMVLATFLPAMTPTTTTTTTRAPTTTTTTTMPPATTTSTVTTLTTTSTTTTLAGACGSPTVIPAQGGTFSGTTSGASQLAGSCGSSGTSPEVVFQWTPSVSGTATIATCGAGTNFDTVLYLRSGACASGSEVGCNDDACNNSTGLFRASRLTPTVTAGQTYFIVVDGYGGAHGTFSLTVTPPAAVTTTTTTPTGSSTTTTTLAGACGSPTVLPAQGGTFSGTTSGASQLAGSCGSSGTSSELVFQWTPSVSGTATIETCGAGTNFDTVLYLRSGACASGSEAGCNDDACTNSTGLFRASRLTPTVTAGQTYFIVVDGYGGAQGTFSLTVTPP